MGKGGIIGKANEPAILSASGIWYLREQFSAVRNGAWPPAPRIVGTNSSTASNLAVVNLPTGIQPGELLIAVVGNNGDRSHTWPAGWTELADSLNGTISSATIGYRIADGTEGSTVTVTQGSTAATAHVSVRISGRYKNPPTISTVAIGTNVSPDSSVVSAPTGGANLYLSVIAGRTTSSFSVTSAPTNYTTEISSINTNLAFAAIASFQSSASTQDPGAWTVGSSGTYNWLAWTIGL